MDSNYNTVVIIGAGFTGITTAIKLGELSPAPDYRIYEQSSEIGGTWHANTYPGCQSDIPGVLYSLSFAPNSNFTTFYPRQPEILTYIKSVAEKYKLGNKISCNMRLEQASWLPETSRWHLELKNLKTEKTFYQECKILISAVGVFATPNTSMDQIRGLQDFKGQVMHTAQWDETVDLKGKRVAIVGNGASATQVVPAIIDQAESIYQFMRTPQTFVPRPSVPVWNWGFHYVPLLERSLRYLVFNMLEFSFMKYKLDTRGFWLRKASEKRVDGYVKSHAPEKYLDILQRDYPLGCKRVIPDPGYLSSLHDPKMNLLKDPVESVTATEVITKSGARYDVDVIILATGFVGGGGNINVVGKSGTPLRQRLRTTMGYKSISLVDFPNFFLGYGPNAVPAHSSAITAIENIAHLMIKVANPVIQGGRDEVEVEKKYEEEWNASTQAELKDHVWQNCNSFFRDETGRNNFTCPWNSYGMFFEMWWPDMKAWRYT